MGRRHVLRVGHLEVMEELGERILVAPLLPRMPVPNFWGFSTTLILTTAAPFSATRPEKSGSPVTRYAGAPGGAAGTVAAGAGAPGPGALCTGALCPGALCTGAAGAAPESAIER